MAKKIIKKKAHARKGKLIKSHLANYKVGLAKGKNQGHKKAGVTKAKTPGGKGAASALVGKIAGVGGKRHPGEDILGGAGHAN